MHKGTEDSEGFVKVNYRRRKKCSNKTLKSLCHSMSTVNIVPSSDFSKKFDDAKLDLSCSNFMHDFKRILLEALVQYGLSKKDIQAEKDHTNVDRVAKSLAGEGFTGIAEIVCYGLGSFLSCVTARYQLAFLIILRESFFPTPDVYLYDPIFNHQEVNVLKKMKFNVLCHNDEGKRTCVKPTIFFMPHCGKPLYNSVLWSNWSTEALQKIVIIGNSFTNIVESVSKSEMKESLFHIFQAQTLVLENSVPNNFKYSDIFNSMSVHTFPSNNLTSAPQNFWVRREEPCYTSDDEIITNSIKY